MRGTLRLLLLCLLTFTWEFKRIIQSQQRREVSVGGAAPRGDRHGVSCIGAPGDGCPPQHIIPDSSPTSQWDIPKNSPEAPAVIERGDM